MSDRGEPKTTLTLGGEPGAPEHARHTGGGSGHHGSRPGHGGGGHGGGSHEEHEGAPEWLISFADNVMLQMGFFVILFALAFKNAGGGGPTKEQQPHPEKGAPTAQQADFAIAVREAFNNPVNVNSTDPRDYFLVQRLRARQRGESDARRDGPKGAAHDVQTVRPEGMYGAGGFLQFDDRSTALNDEARETVLALARQFRGCRTVLQIRGHCSAAEAFGQEDRGMRISYDRALAVAQVLVENGIDWGQIRLTACADNERITPTAYDKASQRSNQRVEVIEIERAAERLDEAPAEAPATPKQNLHD
jgi:flagellar motor protein MotB